MNKTIEGFTTTLNIDGVEQTEIDKLKESKFIVIDGIIFCRKDHAIDIMKDEAKKNGIIASENGFGYLKKKSRTRLIYPIAIFILLLIEFVLWLYK